MLGILGGLTCPCIKGGTSLSVCTADECRAVCRLIRQLLEIVILLENQLVGRPVEITREILWLCTIGRFKDIVSVVVNLVVVVHHVTLGVVRIRRDTLHHRHSRWFECTVHGCLCDRIAMDDIVILLGTYAGNDARRNQIAVGDQTILVGYPNSTFTGRVDTETPVLILARPHLITHLATPNLAFVIANDAEHFRVFVSGRQINHGSCVRPRDCRTDIVIVLANDVVDFAGRRDDQAYGRVVEHNGIRRDALVLTRE